MLFGQYGMYSEYVHGEEEGLNRLNPASYARQLLFRNTLTRIEFQFTPR